MAYSVNPVSENPPVDKLAGGTPRVANTTYQNLTGKSIRVKVVVYLICTTGTGDQTAIANLHVSDSGSGPWDATTRRERVGFIRPLAYRRHAGLEVIVLDGQYYRLVTTIAGVGGSNEANITAWQETTR